MKLNDIDVIGGGPAGLFAAILLRQHMPACRVTVHERSVPDETFGFGVAFTRRTLDVLAEADQRVVAAIEAASIAMPPQEMRIGEHSVQSEGNAGGVTIARSALLGALVDQAERVGVDLRFGSEATLSMVAGADLVIAADGVGSATRSSLSTEFGERVTPGRGLFMWLGCDARLESNLFAPARTPHGLFNIHCYPYAADRSTIGVETNEVTWRAAGMDIWTEETPPGETDKQSLAYLQDVFGDTLGGATLLGNRSRWMHFRTVTTDRWSHGNVAILGDAAHTAHYSVGSGTKMAMEDSVGLVHELSAPGDRDLSEALRAYESGYRPRVARLQELADRSRWWWESLEARLDLPIEALMLAYLSRGGAVSATQLAQSDPSLVAKALGATGFGQPRRSDGDSVVNNLANDVISTPWPSASPRVGSRQLMPHDDLVVRDEVVDIADPWGEDAGRVVAAIAATMTDDIDVVMLTGASPRAKVLDRLAFAEHLRSRIPAAVAVEAPGDLLDDVVDGLLAARIDLFRLTGNENTQPAGSSSSEGSTAA